MDLKKKFRNKAWVLSLISAILLLSQLVLTPLGIKIDNEYVMTVVNAILGVLTLLGVFINPNTPGIQD